MLEESLSLKSSTFLIKSALVDWYSLDCITDKGPIPTGTGGTNFNTEFIAMLFWVKASSPFHWTAGKIIFSNSLAGVKFTAILFAYSSTPKAKPVIPPTINPPVLAIPL